MKQTFRIILGITAITTATVIIYRKRQRNKSHMLKKVADEGYETAHDVLFPRKSKRERDLRFGPTIPL